MNTIEELTLMIEDAIEQVMEQWQGDREVSLTAEWNDGVVTVDVEGE